MDFELPPEDDPRRLAVREWLEEHPEPSDEQLAEAGYVAPHWPRPYGLDADPIHQLVIDEELRRAGVRRPQNMIGIGWAGPTLLAAGTPINTPGWTPLIYAAFEGHLDIVDILIARGANPDLLAPNQASALMYAARNGHIEVVQRLLLAGADATLVNDSGRTAQSWALENGNTDIADLISSHLAKSPAKPKSLRISID